jgi:carboxylesterase type B
MRYGDGANESLDVIPAVRPDVPVLVFIHGGYWRALDASEQADPRCLERADAVPVCAALEDDLNHFGVFDTLADPARRLCALAMELPGA